MRERTRPFEAVIADMDGVLTRTALLHERAWKQTFDAFLAGRQGQPPFSSADYRAEVDGKPRYDGVSDFLASRDIALPWGTPADPPEALTICGLGNRKNRRFRELLDEQGAHVFEEAVAALDRWRRGGLRLAVVSASRNSEQVLRSADLVRRVDVIVGGEVASELELRGKREIMLEAARQLGVDPSDAVILEDATAGVRAGRQGDFGLVVGVARVNNARDLREAGAHQVVTRVFRARFPRRLPPALERLDELSRWRGDKPLAVFVDYDGTLAPIVEDPADAWMLEGTRTVLTELARRCPVAIISGRDRPDVEARVGIAGLAYAGNHGFDISAGSHSKTLPEAEEALADVRLAEDELRHRVGRLSGVIIERKRFSVAVHTRQVDSACVADEVEKTVEAVRQSTTLRRRTGKKVVELEPAVDWDKGRAVRWLLDALPEVDATSSFVVYLGDDETDEDAFAAIEGGGAGIYVGPGTSASLADYHVAGPEQVRELLGALAR